MARTHAVKPQDSGQPPPGTPGDPLADRNDENHPGTRKQHGQDAEVESAEGNDPSLEQGRTRTRKPG
jgi:hypothetical protein